MAKTDTDEALRFGDRLRALLILRDMSVAQLVQRLADEGYPFSEASVHNWIGGRFGAPRGDVCRAICRVVECDYDTLLGKP